MAAIAVYRLITKKKQSISVFLALSVVVTVGFYVLCVLVPNLFLNIKTLPPETIDSVKSLLINMPIYYALTIPVYTMTSYWGICSLGLKKGLLISIINFVITVVLFIMRVPLVMSLQLDMGMLYFFVFPLIVDVITIGITFFMNCLKK